MQKTVKMMFVRKKKRAQKVSLKPKVIKKNLFRKNKMIKSQKLQVPGKGLLRNFP